MVRTTSISTVNYTPGDPGGIQNLDDVRRFLRDETLKLQAVVNALAAGHLDPTHKEPSKPRRGDYRIADGSDWDPGSGEGLYRHDGATWVFIG